MIELNFIEPGLVLDKKQIAFLLWYLWTVAESQDIEIEGLPRYPDEINLKKLIKIAILEATYVNQQITLRDLK